MHQARAEHAGFDGAGNAAGTAHGVDGAHVIAMAVLDRMAATEIDAERSAGQRDLDVVHRERVTREEDVDVAEADQITEVLRAAGVHDDRTGDKRDLPAIGLDAAHHVGDARDSGLHATLRRHFVAHEAEARLVPRLHVGRHADALHAADDEIALADVAEFLAGHLRA